MKDRNFKLLHNRMRIIFFMDLAFFRTRIIRMDGITGTNAMADDLMEKVQAIRSAPVSEKKPDAPQSDRKPGSI